VVKEFYKKRLIYMINNKLDAKHETEIVSNFEKVLDNFSFVNTNSKDVEKIIKAKTDMLAVTYLIIANINGDAHRLYVGKSTDFGYRIGNYCHNVLLNNLNNAKFQVFEEAQKQIGNEVNFTVYACPVDIKEKTDKEKEKAVTDAENHYIKVFDPYKNNQRFDSDRVIVNKVFEMLVEKEKRIESEEYTRI